ncbi:coiled-coil domain-containing protein 42 homolog isoform X2 [Denticeps clupeoides]|uniref:coiled-coil domain-containing protein 42 homolog isoform X2 n=1 Tax=Denticeps clupeoides TaxID=299321 RepID=UPI0010A52727|nr:coiled-coil domain-containing protein 42 homolog isoform X2 [Denticeps clupeoides]
MSLNLEDFGRTLHRGPPASPESSAARLLEKRRDMRDVDASLRSTRQEMEEVGEKVRRREEELRRKEERMKRSVLIFDKFVQENDAKRVRNLQKAETERTLVRRKVKELESLGQKLGTLLSRKEQLWAVVNRAAFYHDFLDAVVKKSSKLLERAGVVDSETEEERQRLRRYVSERSSALLQQNTSLSQLQTRLDRARSLALKWETTWTRVQSTAAGETLLLGQIQAATLNLYHAAGGVLGGAEGVGLDDTVRQLEKIHLFIKDRTDIVKELQSDAAKSAKN